MSWDDIRKLTWHQYATIVCHERDRAGNLVPRYVEPKAGRAFASDKERIFDGWQRRWSWTPAQCEMKWAENQELARFRAELGREELAPEEFDRRVAQRTCELLSQRLAR